MKQTLVALAVLVWALFLPLWIVGSETEELEETCLGMDGASDGSCAPDRNESLPDLALGEDMGVAQAFIQGQEAAIAQVIQATREYLETVVYPDPRMESVRDTCKNQHELCAVWASTGECEANPGYMRVSCAPVCQTCAYLSRETRCPLDPNAVDALYPGDLNVLFERISTAPEYAKYEPKVWFRPYPIPGDTIDTAPYQIGPWVLTFEKFITPDEANRLIELGKARGYEPSGLVRGVKEDGTIDSYIGDEVRTSSNTWCTDECMDDPIVKEVTNRIVNLTGIIDPNYEFLQMLQYEQGQFYRAHTDYIDHHVQRQEGVRLLTLFMYLNDVEEGGGTHFPNLNLTVTPKQGRAALWPSVLNEDPNQVDERTNHESVPVVKGVKYGANAWIHQRNFKTPFENGCE